MKQISMSILDRITTLLGIDIDRTKRTIVLSILTIDINMRHDNDLSTLIEIE
jgi:hypothetical protein